MSKKKKLVENRENKGGEDEEGCFKGIGLLEEIALKLMVWNCFNTLSLLASQRCKSQLGIDEVVRNI
ncbi:unnamed protein product [Callosobruchus maculatus]|uniref:Uncharacterized protein n=1 Tax=Callosobruchus maculatus TaxID=64391 RepID=A0A653CHD3_CALMS|nr:unnamed protein product [Callosobruchus maculatus]